MILDKDFSDQYIKDYLDGNIKQGLGIGSPLMDQHIKFKRGQLNFILGMDNVGKTFVTLWYLLALSVKHGLTWTVWSGENNPAVQKRQLIEMLAGQNLKDLTPQDLKKYRDLVESWFKFVDVAKMYDHKQLLKVFLESNTDGYLVDPYTALNHNRAVNGFDRNYQFCNEAREFCNKYDKTIYTCLHPVTEATRRFYTKEHELAGHIQPPRKADAEGGQAFANRADDFIIIHRYVQHEHLKFTTMMQVAKIKDTETGGTPTMFNNPIRLDFNYGKGFKIGLDEPIAEWRERPQDTNAIKPNDEFDGFDKFLEDDTLPF